MSEVGPTAQRRPWWQTARTVRQGYACAAFFLVVGLTNLATFSGGGQISKWVQLGLGVWGMLLAALYLTTAIALRRYQTCTPDPGAGREADARWRGGLP